MKKYVFLMLGYRIICTFLHESQHNHLTLKYLTFLFVEFILESDVFLRYTHQGDCASIILIGDYSALFRAVIFAVQSWSGENLTSTFSHYYGWRLHMQPPDMEPSVVIHVSWILTVGDYLPYFGTKLIVLIIFSFVNHLKQYKTSMLSGRSKTI